MGGRWCALCALLGACAWWQALRSVVPFIVFKHQEKLKGNHSTLLCRAGAPCGLAAAHFTLSPEELAMNSVFSPDLSDEESGRIFARLERRLAERGPGGGRPLVVHVGPADLDEEDLGMYARLAPSLRAAGGGVAFVEPHPQLRAQLRERLRGLPNASGLSTTILPVAVCPEEGGRGGEAEGGGASLFKISDRFFRDFKETGWLYLVRYWAGLSREHLVRELQVFSNQTGKVWFFKAVGLLPGHFPSTLEEWMPYVEELPIRCLAPSGLLRELGAAPGAVEVLIVDAEGYDTELVGLFLGMDGFSPSAVMFEWHLHSNDPAKLRALVKLARALHARGYDLHRHNHDVIAVAP